MKDVSLNEKRERKMITVEYAKYVLENLNDVNRPLSMATARKYAAEMKAGTWDRYSPDNKIVFYEDGKLADGQHTLMAVVLYGESVPMWVITGVSRKISVMDRGRNRSTHDIFAMNGIKTSQNVIALIRYMLKLYGISYISDALCADYFILHDKELELATRLVSTKAKGTRNVNNTVSRAVAYMALLNNVDAKVIERFFSVINSLEYDGEKEYAAMMAYRYISDLHRVSNISVANAGGRSWLSVCSQALSDFAAKKPRKKAYKTNVEPKYLAYARFVDSAFIDSYRRA